jgi:hypothetical protein
MRRGLDEVGLALMALFILLIGVFGFVQCAISGVG